MDIINAVLTATFLILATLSMVKIFKVLSDIRGDIYFINRKVDILFERIVKKNLIEYQEEEAGKEIADELNDYFFRDKD
jgi:hypothetical protein